MMMVMYECVPAAAPSKAHIGEGRYRRDNQGERKTTPEERLIEARAHRPWNDEHDCIVHDLHDAD